MKVLSKDIEKRSKCGLGSRHQKVTVFTTIPPKRGVNKAHNLKLQSLSTYKSLSS